MKYLVKVLKTIAVPLIMYIIMMIFFPANMNGGTIINILYQAVAPAILAWGTIFNVDSGNWDFSLGAVALTAAVIGGNLAVMSHLGIVGVIVLCTLIGIVCGAINGILYYLLKIPTIIISIATCMLFESICGIVFGGMGVMADSGMIVLNSFPAQMFVLIVVFALVYIIYNFRPIGYHVRAVGNNSAIAAQSGINVYKIKVYSFAIAGMFAGIYAAVTLGTNGVYRLVSTSLGTMTTCFDALMCVYIGLSLKKNSNLIIATYVGAVFLRLLKLFIIFTHVPSSYDQIFTAVFVLVFLCYSTYNNSKIAEKIAKRRVLSDDEEAVKAA